MEYVPLGRDVVIRVATPAVFKVAVPSTLVPFVKVTVPVGLVDVTEELMVAANVTLVPGGTGVVLLTVEVSVVAVVASETGTDNAVPVLPPKLLSPL
jgi:hypothetical protein